MKKILVVAIVCAFFGMVAAPEARAMRLGGYAAYLDGDDLGSGAGAGAVLRFDFLGEAVGLDIRGSYLRFDDIKTDLIPLETAVTARLPIGRLGAYAGLGVGYYLFDMDDGSADDSVGVFPLVGADFQLSDKLSLFGEARWLFLDTDVDAAVKAAEDLTEDSLDLDGLGVNLGLSWRF
jgi:hypothetical protein